MWRHYLADTLNGDNHSNYQQGQRSNHTRQSFCFAITVRVSIIGRCDRYEQAAPHDERSDYVRSRLDAIGYQRVRVSEHASDDLERC